MKMNESHLKLEFHPLHSGAGSCNFKCALGYGDVVMLLIIHDSLAEPQQAKLQTILVFSIFLPPSRKVSRVSQQMSPS